MKKGNVIDLVTYRDQYAATNTQTHTPISEELETAIQLLIHRLRVLGPLL